MEISGNLPPARKTAQERDKTEVKAQPCAAPVGAWGRPELPAFVFVSMLCGLLLVRESILLRDLDIGWLLRYGEMIWQTGRLPVADEFSFTRPGQPWVLYQWGFQVYLAGLQKVAGLGGVIWGTAALVALTYALLLYLLLDIGLHRLWSIGLCLLAALANCDYWHSRPGTANFLFFLVVLILLEKYRRAPGRQLWGLPPLFLLWANVHIGLVAGLAPVLAYGFWACVDPEDFRGQGASRDYRILAIFPLCLAAICLNPQGVHLVPYIRQATGSTYLNNNIMELQSPNFHHPIHLFFFLQLTLLLWLSISIYPARKLFLTLICLTLAMALYSARHLTFFSLTATLVLGHLLISCWGWRAAATREPPAQGWAWATVGAAVALVLAAGVNHLWPGHYDFEARVAPRGATAFLQGYAREDRPLKVFCQDDQWSSYFIYKLFPGIRVFMDSRYEFYGEAFIKRAAVLQRQAAYGPQVLNPWGVDFLVLKKEKIEAIPEAREDWSLVYEDHQALVYRHQPLKAKVTDLSRKSPAEVGGNLRGLNQSARR